MKATQYSTNKYGDFIPYTLKCARELAGTKKATVKETVKDGGHIGFGVAITGSSCYNLAQMEKEKRRIFLESIYSEKGLGLSLGRLTIGSSDYSAEIYTYDDTPDDSELLYFSIERDKEYIIPMIKEILAINPKITLFASPWSPPGWMKTGGSIGGGYMRDSYIDCYADYIIKYLKAYAAEGIKIKAITPQNEPNTQQGGLMPACIWHPDIEAKFISVLKRKLKNEGLGTEVWMFDHNFSDHTRVDWMIENYDKLQNECNGIAFHYYSGAIEDTVYLRKKYNLDLHFTEGGPRLYDHYDSDFCKWGQMMIKSLKCSYSSFTGWNLMLDEAGGPNIGPFFCGGLVTLSRQSGDISYSGQYKAFRHFSPFINSNSKIYPVFFDRNEMEVSSYYSKGGAIEGCFIENSNSSSALIIVNPSDKKSQVSFTYMNKVWYIEVLPETLTTVVFE